MNFIEPEFSFTTILGEDFSINYQGQYWPPQTKTPNTAEGYPLRLGIDIPILSF
jgi:hypothetical protein